MQDVYARCRREINGRPLSDFVPLEKSRGRLMYCCPVCGSGTGKNRTGALRLYAPQEGNTGRWRVHCFAGHCFGDGGTDTLGALRILNPELSEWQLFQRFGLRPEAEAPAREAPRTAPARDTGAIRGQISRWAEALSGSPGEEYLLSRGISPETMRRFRLGYDPEHWFGALGRREPAVILPYPGADYYAARAIREKAFDKPRTSEAGAEPVFQAQLVGDGSRRPLFVVESQLCAITLAQEGFDAVALGNTGSARLLALLEEKQPEKALVLCLDNDPQEAGKPLQKGPKAQAELEAVLQAHAVPCLCENVAGDWKDPNEALQEDAQGLRRRLEAAARRAEACLREAEAERSAQQAREETDDEAQRFEYAQSSAGGQMEQFRRHVAANRDTPPLPTGLGGLDRMLDGGLYAGLYILGAVTSLGKTTFALQVADHLAENGQDVLYFSLEMSRFELMAKSISRLTFLLAEKNGWGTDPAKTTRSVLSGKRYDQFSEREQSLLREAEEAYARIGSRLWIEEGVGDLSAAQVRERVERHIRLTGRRPVVVIDYVQILAPMDIRATDKQNVDRNVLELKRLSRDRNLPLIAISSFNRENYTQPINLTAFKEAGSLEYGADCLMALQYDGMDYQDGEAEKTREKRIRELSRENETRARRGEPVLLQLKLLKNRNGSRGSCPTLYYIPKFNCFREDAPDVPFARKTDPFAGMTAVRLKT